MLGEAFIFAIGIGSTTLTKIPLLTPPSGGGFATKTSKLFSLFKKFAGIVAISSFCEIYFVCTFNVPIETTESFTKLSP